MAAPDQQTSGLMFHALTTEQTLKALDSSEQGLSTKQVRKRLERYGPNQIEQVEQISAFKIARNQFTSFLVYLLIGASLLSLIMGEVVDAIAIVVIVIINAVLGFIQEFKAEQALEALKSFQTHEATVLRDGKIELIPAESITVGDVLVLKEGDKIPADARLITATSLQTDESSLTGESRPISKKTSRLDTDVDLSERFNMVYSGTGVIRGKGTAVVYATGMSTEFGQIAHLVQVGKITKTPLQKTLTQLGTYLGLISIGIALPGFGLGTLLGRPMAEMLLLSVSLMVSAIPEGLPIVVTITLAIGAQRMIKHNALIRKLPAVEALGSINVICTDKTGTLTKNQMSVVELANYDKNIRVPEEIKPAQQTNASNLVWSELIQCGLICNDATEERGDPTEKALVELAKKYGFPLASREEWERVDEVPFNSDQKFMITLNKKPNEESFAFCLKGAPERVLDMCSHVQTESGVQELTQVKLGQLENTVNELSSRGLRVLALAKKKHTLPSKPRFTSKHDGYVFLGIVGLLDPPRPEVAASLEQCRTAGIRVIMITGDHPLTAKTVAESIGFSTQKVLSGQEIENMDRTEFEDAVKTCDVFARVSPLHKLQILQVLQSQDQLVAMTGDGVNDAPALKEAHIGVAVGSATDLAKEVADMVILDDNFATITQAVYIGRGIFSNIKKFVMFLVSANFVSILVLFGSLLFGTPVPFLPIHILWLNVLTDGAPALALAVDAFDQDLMHKPPLRPEHEIMKGVISFSTVIAALGFLSSFGLFIYYYYGRGVDLFYAQSVIFTVFVLYELSVVFSVRSQKHAFSTGLLSNKWLLLAVAVSLGLQFIALYFPPVQTLLKTTPILAEDWPIILAVGTSGFFIIEIVRFIKHEARVFPDRLLH